jgi:imidazoleglycerol-phosphate dehydratase
MARIGYQAEMDATSAPLGSSVSDTAPRAASLTRATSETEVTIRLDLDGTGRVRAETGIGFFDHMLTALGRHALFDLDILARGDLHVDFHHTVEDVGIVLGQLILKTVGDKRGIGRYGQALVPMDEALVEAAIDLSGRATLGWQVAFTRPKIGEMDTELFEEFFRALSANGLFALHLIQRAGRNDHHIAEGCFKATARALRMAVEPDDRQRGLIPSTKGSLAG